MYSDMSWFRDDDEQVTWLQRLCARVLRAGPIPRHIAFIMDGNRRFAVRNKMERLEGHVSGFEKLAETLSWCRELDIKTVTVYAFSIENFKRSREEVDGLMELGRKKFQRLLEEKPLIEKYGVCVRVLGDTSLLPVDVQHLIADIVLFSRHNTNAVLNVCLSYTSRQEIANASRLLASAVERKQLLPSDVTEELLDKCMYSSPSPNPDLLVRTSGEVRLSDFLLWQTTHSLLLFLPALWPDLTIWHLFAGVLHYQAAHKHLEEAKKTHEQLKCRLQDDCDLEHLRQEVASIRSRFPDPESESGHPLMDSGTEAGADVEIEKRAGDDDSNMDAARHASDSNMADATPAGELGSYRRARDERIDRFLHWLEDDRLQQLQRLQQQHQQQQQQHHQQQQQQQQQQQVPLEPQQEGLCARS